MSKSSNQNPLTTHGHIARELACGSWILTDAAYGPAAHYPHHEHEHPYLCLVLAGAFREEHRGRTEMAEAGSVVLMPAGHPHRDLIAPYGARSFVLTLGQATSGECIPRDWSVQRGGPFTRAMLTILTVARGNSLDESTIEEELISAAGQLSSSPRFRSCPEVARQARDYLVAHREAPFRLSTMAEALGVDRSYLARAFRRAYGCTMGAYRRMLRLQCAMGLIADRTPLARAAISAGFADQSHLSRTFRQELGVTAAAYGTLAAGPEA